MGLVVFAGFAELAVAPTTDRSVLDRATQQPQHQPGHRHRRRRSSSRSTPSPRWTPRSSRSATPCRAPRSPRRRPPGGLAVRAGPRTLRQAQRQSPAKTATCPTSSSCSPTAPTTAASRRSRPSLTPWPGGSGSTRSASARPIRLRWCALRSSRAVSPQMAASAVAASAVAATAAGRGTAEGSAAGRPLAAGGRPAPAPAGVPAHRWRQLLGQGRLAAQQSVRQFAETRCRPEGAPRGHRRLSPSSAHFWSSPRSGRQSGGAPTRRSA